MTQEQVTQIVNTHYSDKIQMATLTPTDINCLLFKTLPTGLREFKGYSVIIDDVPLEFENTEEDIMTVLDVVVENNAGWYNS